MKYIAIISLLVLTINCGSQRGAVSSTVLAKNEKQDTTWYSYSKHYDEVSETYYFLTRIKNKDSQGNLNKLKLAQSTALEGETVHDFARRAKVTLAFNASMGIKRKSDTDKLLPVGIQIVNGEILQNRKSRVYTLGIKSNNQLVAYPPGTTPKEILADGAQNAFTAFIPLIENYQAVDDSLFDLVANFRAIHPRQIIAQMENLDIVFLSCGGRGYDGKGMTAMDVIRVLKNEGVKFAFMLDGGGSTSTVINDTLITKKIDNHGTKERLRPNFLYFR